MADLNLFSPKEAQLQVKQLQKLYTRNIAALKWYPPLTAV